MNKINDYVRVGASVPNLQVGNIEYNVEEIKTQMKKSASKGVEITVFPELSITSSTLGDMLSNNLIIEKSLSALIELKKYTKKVKGIFILGLPLRIKNKLLNVAAILEDGHILGIVPKAHGDRHFDSGRNIEELIIIDKEEVFVSTKLLFERNNHLNERFYVIIGKNSVVENSHPLEATMVFNLDATPRIVGRKENIIDSIKYITRATNSAYVYASSSLSESTTSYCYLNLACIVENGHVLNKDDKFTFESKLIYNDIDISKLLNLQIKDKKCQERDDNYHLIYYNGVDTNNILIREYDEYPFIPKEDSTLNEILNIQAFALAKRLQHLNMKNAVVGISGGLDSTLAFLVTIKAFDILKIDRSGIFGITLPGFGTSDRTFQNALKLIKEYGATLKEISIKEACIQHFYDIDHDKNIHDITYENTQARERTQILLDYANKVNGIVIGTGDLSELALGWCTYNGDHMSNYSVNASIPKTLVRFLVKYYADNESNEDAKNILLDILDTPVSPELLPPSESGKILQVTENVVGPYVLHDFFLYHLLKDGASPQKLYLLACTTFKDMEKILIKKWLEVFIRRFLRQQFKRNCSPDGPSVGNINLSPHGGLVMPSDISIDLWEKELKNLQE